MKKRTEQNSGKEREPEPETRIFHLPLLEGQLAALQVPYPMSEDDWEQMHKILEAMKPGMVKDVPKKEVREEPKLEEAHHSSLTGVTTRLEQEAEALLYKVDAKEDIGIMLSLNEPPS